ncbi:MAG: hypothetical protein ACC726_08565 [Chloroflexota bacterium]
MRFIGNLLQDMQRAWEAGDIGAVLGLAWIGIVVLIVVVLLGLYLRMVAEQAARPKSASPPVRPPHQPSGPARAPEGSPGVCQSCNRLTDERWTYSRNHCGARLARVLPPESRAPAAESATQARPAR